MARNDVLIIGAGPSGLFAAAERARPGVEALASSILSHYRLEHASSWLPHNPKESGCVVQSRLHGPR
jgi:threonine dehydrogenase-like Zn-dependent dehydrogenase